MLEHDLYALTAAYGPSGREDGVTEAIRSLAVPHCQEIRRDPLGNLIAYKPGVSGKKLMLCAHMDQIGLMVTDVDPAGFLRVAAVGGLQPAYAIARQVAFQSGVMGTVFFGGKDKKPQDAKMEDLFIDIGAKDQAAAEALVSIGEVAVFHAPLRIQGSLAVGGALDDRLGCALVLEALRQPCPHDLYGVFTVQEEVGTRGAGPAAYGIQPDLAIALDVTPAGDWPEAPPSPIALGKGPALKLMDGSVVVSQPVRERMAQAAQAAGIPFQREVLKAGGTDTGVISRTLTGIAAGCISFPCRYVHTPVETVDLSDAQGACVWIKAIMEGNL